MAAGHPCPNIINSNIHSSNAINTARLTISPNHQICETITGARPEFQHRQTSAAGRRSRLQREDGLSERSGTCGDSSGDPDPHTHHTGQLLNGAQFGDWTRGKLTASPGCQESRPTNMSAAKAPGPAHIITISMDMKLINSQ